MRTIKQSRSSALAPVGRLRPPAVSRQECPRSVGLRCANRTHEIDPTGVSRCCASHFSLLAQQEVTKRKDTLHCVDAVHRCLALLAGKGAAGNSLRSNIRLLFPFLAVLLSAAPRG